jgi:hypothetical protein
VYLVHITLIPPPDDRTLPPWTGVALMDALPDSRGIEHVTVHEREPGREIVGVFVRAGSLREAEHAVAEAWRGFVRARRELGAWAVLNVGAPLIPVF